MVLSPRTFEAAQGAMAVSTDLQVHVIKQHEKLCTKASHSKLYINYYMSEAFGTDKSVLFMEVSS